jgi:hypothetical protein
MGLRFPSNNEHVSSVFKTVFLVSTFNHRALDTYLLPEAPTQTPKENDGKKMDAPFWPIAAGIISLGGVLRYLFLGN